MKTLQEKAYEIWSLMGHPIDSPEFPLSLIASAVNDAEKFIVTLFSKNVELLPSSLMKEMSLPTLSLRETPSPPIDGNEQTDLGNQIEYQVRLPADCLRPVIVKLKDLKGELKIATFYSIENFYNNLTFQVNQFKGASGYYWTVWGKQNVIITPANFVSGKILYIAVPPPLNWQLNPYLSLPEEYDSIINNFVLSVLKSKVKDYAGAKLCMDIAVQQATAYLKVFQVDEGRA